MSLCPLSVFSNWNMRSGTSSLGGPGKGNKISKTTCEKIIFRWFWGKEEMPGLCSVPCPGCSHCRGHGFVPSRHSLEPPGRSQGDTLGLEHRTLPRGCSQHIPPSPPALHRLGLREPEVMGDLGLTNNPELPKTSLTQGLCSSPP